MTSEDLVYIRGLMERSLLEGPCLEVGAGLEGANCKSLAESFGIEYFGGDITAGPIVDFVVDFEGPLAEIESQVAPAAPFGSVLVLNVLEHCFDPIRVLDNVFAILKPGGTCVALTPTVWPLHSYPLDCWRILPGFYREYCRRRSHRLLEETLEYVGYGPVENFRRGDDFLPPPGKSNWQRRRSRVVHKLFDTFGRSMFFPSHVATAVAIRKVP